MPLIIEITNPFEPLRDTRTSEAREGVTVAEWLQERFPGFVEFSRPTICVLNGQGLLRADWKTRKLERDDVVNLVAMPAGLDPITWLWIAFAALTVTGVVVALNMKQNLPTPGQTTEADPVYSLKGQRNQIRLGEPVESAVGRNRMWPSYAAKPYNKYKDNKQWLYQLFTLGHGQFTLSDAKIEDTPLADFQDVEIEICPPGTPVTLFPDNVITSVEVSNVELFGPNEAGSGVYIQDSEGDADFGIAATGHYAYATAGPWVANPSGTQTNKLEMDISFPRGLFQQNDSGALANMAVSVLFEARKINDAGVPVGAWTTIANVTKTMATITPQRFTIEADVDLGRYEVRAARTSNKNTDSRSGNDLHWETLRAFLPSTRDYGNKTVIALAARATNNLNDNAASRFNIIGTRWLRSWNTGSQSWNAAAPTRSLVWAFCDIFQATYGGRLANAFLDLNDLAARDAVFNARGEFFDWIFDQRISVWDAARLAALVGRAVPMLNGSRIGLVRDEPKTLPTAIFNQENTVKGSFRYEIKLSAPDEFDGLLIEYVDADTWKPETVLCLLPGQAGNNPEKLKLNGVTSRTHAYRWGMWRAASNRYRREQITFRTGLEGHIPSYGDAMGSCQDVLRWGQGGFVLAIDGAGTGLTLSEPVTFAAGVHKICLRKKNGQATDPLTVTAGADSTHVTLAVPIDAAEFSFDPQTEPPLFTFGPQNLVNKLCVVTNIVPSSDDEVEINATVYRQEPHNYDAANPPALGNTSGNLPGTSALPSVFGLVVNRSPEMQNEVVASWIPTPGASFYVIQLSYDGVAYETLSDYVEATNFRFSVLPKFIYVRVCAVTTAAGGWAYWTGDAPVELTNVVFDNNATPAGVSGVTTQAGFGMNWLQWVNSTNAKLKRTHIYASLTNTLPLVPTFQVPWPQAFFGHSGLEDNAQWFYWFKEESVGGKFSTVSGPYARTTVNGITLDHLIPGGLQPVEIVTAIPSTGNYKGRLVFLTANDGVGTTIEGTAFVADKVYRWTGGGTVSAKVSGKGNWTAAVPAVDLTGQIVSGQIADNAVLQAKLADNAVSQSKLQDNIISTAKLVDGAINSAKLAALAVATANIQLDAITNDLIAAGAVGSTEIANDAISTPKLAAGSITAAKIGAGEVVTSKLAAGAVTANEIAALAVTAGKIDAGAVTAGKIAAGAVSTNELAANAVTAAKIGAGEITTAKLAAGAVTANELAANSVVAGKLAAGAIVAGTIAAGAITSAELAADAVIAGKIQAGAIVAAAVGTNEIIAFAANIKDGIITTAKIGDAQINTAKIGDLQVSTLKIGNNAVTVPISANATGSISVAPNATVGILTCGGMDVVGSEPVFLIFSTQCTPVDNDTFFFRFKRDGTIIQEWEWKAPIIGKNAVTFMYPDASPGAGTYNYYMEIFGKNTNSGTAGFAKNCMLALSTKK